METEWAAQHLQVIRTLMERSAIYRRALAPIMLFAGTVGILAALGGAIFRVDRPLPFILYWLAVGLVPLLGAYLLVRRQALKADEVFWSPPTRRVTQALLPPLAAGFFGSLMLAMNLGKLDSHTANVVAMLWLPEAWVVLYGCALHAAGFFMPRGMKLFGWSFVLGGCVLFALGAPEFPARRILAHGIMGLFFGVLHLAYGGYLYFTEKKKSVT